MNSSGVLVVLGAFVGLGDPDSVELFPGEGSMNSSSVLVVLRYWLGEQIQIL